MSQQSLNILISGGGTGGHIFPALAIAEAIRTQRPGARFLFVGARGRMEMERVPAAGYPIEGLWISGLQRRMSLSNLAFPFKIIHSLVHARRILRRFRPAVAVGVGGYASAPALWMASRMGIPTLIQEQNSFPGIANRILARTADIICVAYEGMDRYFPASAIRLTGNPVRHTVLPHQGKRAEALQHFGLSGNSPVLLSIGGSLGARTMNEAIAAGLDTIHEAGIQLIWQTGKAFIGEAERLAAPYPGIRPYAFIQRMDLAYSLADLVVSRAGAIAIAELSAAGMPSILVPSPNVTEDHQTKNALALVQKGAALMIRDAEAQTQLVPGMIELAQQSEKRRELAGAIKNLAHPDADRLIATLALELAERNTNRQ